MIAPIPGDAPVILQLSSRESRLKMAAPVLSSNVFSLLDEGSEDPQQLAAAMKAAPKPEPAKPKTEAKPAGALSAQFGSAGGAAAVQLCP